MRPNPTVRSAAADAPDDEQADPSRLTNEDSIARVVVRAVAAELGSDLVDLEPLCEAVDPVALDAVCGRDDPHSVPRSISFEYHGCDVTVRRGVDVYVERNS